MTLLDPPHPDFPAGMADWGFECLTVLGILELLRQPLVGVASSRQCPAGLMLAAHDWAKTARKQNLALVGGFHSPVEQEVLRVVLKGMSGLVLCPARGLEGMRLGTDLKKTLEAGRLLLVSPFGVGVRRAERRNRLVVGLASRVLVIHAAPGSATKWLVREVKDFREVKDWGKQMEELEALS